jgi:predicted nucleic acid-binding protein
MAINVFVDTGVIIDYLTDRTTFANQSSMIFELQEQTKIQIYISALRY